MKVSNVVISHSFKIFNPPHLNSRFLASIFKRHFDFCCVSKKKKYRKFSSWWLNCLVAVLTTTTPCVLCRLYGRLATSTPSESSTKSQICRHSGGNRYVARACAQSCFPWNIQFCARMQSSLLNKLICNKISLGIFICKYVDCRYVIFGRDKRDLLLSQDLLNNYFEKRRSISKTQLCNST